MSQLWSLDNCKMKATVAARARSGASSTQGVDPNPDPDQSHSQATSMLSGNEAMPIL